MRAFDEFKRSPIQVAAATVAIVAALGSVATAVFRLTGDDTNEPTTPTSVEGAAPAASQASGGDVPSGLSLEESEVALVVEQAQTSFREGRVRTYCNTRTVSYLQEAYGGGYPYATCLEAGERGLRAEQPRVLRGPLLDIEGVAIEGGGNGTEAIVRARQGRIPIEVEVRRLPPDDDVWRVARFESG